MTVPASMTTICTSLMPQVVQRQAGRHQRIGPGLLPPVCRVLHRKQGALVRLVGKRLHHAHAAHVLLDPCVEPGNLAELRPPAPVHARAVVEGQPGRSRHHHRGDHRQRPTDAQHQHESAQERQQRHQQVLRPMVRDLADVGQVGCHTADQVAGLLPVVEPHRERVQVVEGPAPHLRLDPDPQHVTPVVHHSQQPGIGQVKRQQRPDREQDRPHRAGGKQPVNEGPHRHRKAQLQHPGQGGAAEHHQQQAPVRAVVGTELTPHGSGPRTVAGIWLRASFAARAPPFYAILGYRPA